MLEEFEALIMTHGNWVFLRKANTKKRCYCFNVAGKNYSEGNPYCTTCFGTGWWQETYQIKIRQVTGISLQERSFWGDIDENEKIFYIYRKIKPELEDDLLFLDITEDGKVKLPIKILSHYNIVSVKDFRGTNGKLIYYGVKAKKLS